MRIYIKFSHTSDRGPVYEARLDSPDGPLLVAISSEPELAAARALLARGITGKVEAWDAVRPFPRMSGDIETLAKLMVVENDTGLRVRRWMPFPSARQRQKSASEPSRLPEYPPHEEPPTFRERAACSPGVRVRP